MNFRILYLYPDIMDLYGDNGNIKILKYRLLKRNIKSIVDTYTIGDKIPNFRNYDLIFMGGGPDNEQQIISSDLLKFKNEITKAYDEKVFFLLICGGYQLFGKYYQDSNDEKIEGLNILDYYTIASNDKRKRCIGNLIIETKLNNTKIKILGFENHGGQTYDVKDPFGKVIYGNGNIFNDKFEGVFKENLIGTYSHGPILSKNPELADYIIEYGLKRKEEKEVTLKKLDDSFELKAREIMFKRLIKKETE